VLLGPPLLTHVGIERSKLLFAQRLPDNSVSTEALEHRRVMTVLPAWQLEFRHHE